MRDSGPSPPRNRRVRRAPLVLVVAALLCGIGAGCGLGGGEASEAPDYERALAGSPPRLAALHAQANELLPGGAGAYERRLAALRGFPVVVNVWASWCGPCRLEFPHFQQAAARFGKRVAFLGVASEDGEEQAGRFLAEAPVPYPSYLDPDDAIGASLGSRRGLPKTAFYDRRGELVEVKQGPYTSDEELAAAIEAKALGQPTEGG